MELQDIRLSQIAVFENEWAGFSGMVSPGGSKALSGSEWQQTAMVVVQIQMAIITFQMIMAVLEMQTEEGQHHNQFDKWWGQHGGRFWIPG